MTEATPNVIFILGDDWGWGDLGSFGHPRVATPNLDRLAEQGARFTQFYVAAPVCSPSRVSFMTGRFPAECGFHHVVGNRHERNMARGLPDYLSLEFDTVSASLRDAGYSTAHFGKWHMGSTPDAPTPADYGFDDYAAVNATGRDLKREFFAAQSPSVDIDDLADSDVEFRPHSSRAIIDRAIDWLGDQSDAPFFLQIWLLDPHAILNPPEEHMVPYRDLSARGVDHPGAMAIYYSVLTEADRQLGRLFEALDALNLAENTLIVFTGDNGPEDAYVPAAAHSAAGSSGPFRGRKRSLYEGGIRMPLITRWPGRIRAGRVDDRSVISSVDLFPTLADLAGARIPAGLPGESRLSALIGEEERLTELYWEYRFPNGSHPVHRSPSLAIRSGPWKLLTNPDGSRTELYDIPADPMELTDLSDQHPDLVHELAARVSAWSQTLPPGPRHPSAGSNTYPWPTENADRIVEQTWEPGL